MDLADKHKMLTHLLASNAVLRERMTWRSSLGEVACALYTHLNLLQDKPVTLTDLTAFTGIPMSTISGWLKRRSYISTVQSEDDERLRFIQMDDIHDRTDFLQDILDALRDIQSVHGAIQPGTFSSSYLSSLYEATKGK